MADLDNNGWGAGGGGRTPPSPRREDNRDARDKYAPQSRDADMERGDRGRGGENPGNNLHVAGLSPDTQDTDLAEVFGKFGNIEKASIMLDPHTKESRGFGFVTFELVEDAEAAMAALNATILDKSAITVEKAKRKRARTPTPGQYHGPPKRERDFGGRGGYEPRRDDRYGGGGGYGGRPRYDDRRGGSGYGGSMAAPMRGDDRGDRRYDDRPPRSYERGPYDGDRAPRGYDDRRGPAPDDRRDYGRRERDYDDRPRRDAGEPRRY